jgi:CRP-like cAMP-binding protein
VNHFHHGFLIDSHHRAIGHCGCGAHAAGLSCEAAFSEEITLVQNALAYLLTRNIRYEEDLVDQLFNSSEKRLARVSPPAGSIRQGRKTEVAIPKISQETLAEMVGTTRSRVNFFMNRFQKLGFVRYNGELEVHSSLLNVVLHD